MADLRVDTKVVFPNVIANNVPFFAGRGEGRCVFAANTKGQNGSWSATPGVVRFKKDCDAGNRISAFLAKTQYKEL